MKIKNIDNFNDIFEERTVRMGTENKALLKTLKNCM